MAVAEHIKLSDDPDENHESVKLAKLSSHRGWRDLALHSRATLSENNSEMVNQIKAGYRVPRNNCSLR